MKILRLVCLAFLLMLTSCGLLAKMPPDQAVRIAITQQLTRSQQSLAQDLGLNETTKPDTNFKLEKVEVSSRQPITDAELLANSNVTEAYRVRGTFSAKLTGSSNRNQSTDTPFELYLGTDTTDENEVQTWFVIRP